MNRRGFFKSLVATAIVAVASRTQLGETVLPSLAEPEGDFSTADMRYKCTERFSHGWTNLDSIFGSEGT